MHHQMRQITSKLTFFCKQLGSILNRVLKHSMNILMGDINVNIGEESENSNREMGKHGLEYKNNGEKLLQLCSDMIYSNNRKRIPT